jgi:hypothetical protein
MVEIYRSMKNLFILSIIVFLFPRPSFSQREGLNKSTYDFWLGTWDAEWKNADGSTGGGTNHVTKVLNGTVLEENFAITTGSQAGFLGKSLSVMDVNGKWHQAWVDNQGGYYNFIGEVIDEKKIFKTNLAETAGKKVIQRMVFYDIKKDSFTWDWESTQDGGEVWKLLWRIKYTRQN